MQANSWQIRLPCSCGGAMRGTSPDEAHPGLLSKPLNAAIERVLAQYCRGGRHGRRLQSKTQNTTKKLFLATEAKSYENFAPQNRPSTQLINATSFVQCEMPCLELNSLRTFLCIKRCEGKKLEKLLSNHESQFISWRICAPLVVKLLLKDKSAHFYILLLLSRRNEFSSPRRVKEKCFAFCMP